MTRIISRPVGGLKRGRIVERARGRAAGFTLVELLVVIAIITVLMSILLPTLQNATALSRQVSCVSNLRNISMAFTLYRGDYRDLLPPFQYNIPGEVSHFEALEGGDIGYFGETCNLTFADALEREGYTEVAMWNCTSLEDNPGPNYGWGGLWTHSSAHDFWYTNSFANWPYDPNDPIPFEVIAYPSRSFHLMDKTWDGHGVWPWDQNAIHVTDGTFGVYNNGSSRATAGRRSVLFFDGHIDTPSERGWSVYHDDAWVNGRDGDVFWYQVKNGAMPRMTTWSSEYY